MPPGDGFFTVSQARVVRYQADDLVEGALTMFFAVVAAVMLPDFPHNTRYGFTKEEIQVAQLRMLEDVSHLGPLGYSS